MKRRFRSKCEIDSVFASETALTALKERIGDRVERWIAVDDSLFQTIAGTETTQGVIALVKSPQWSLGDLFGKPALVLALDAIQDPGNAGAMVRAAEAFGATGVAFLKGSVNPYNPKALRASAGSTFRIPVAVGVGERDLITASLDHNCAIFAMDGAGGTPIDNCRLDLPCILIVGNEGRGVNPDLRQQAESLRIPTIQVESLNAAMAATVALYEARRQRTAKRHEPL